MKKEELQALADELGENKKPISSKLTQEGVEMWEECAKILTTKKPNLSVTLDVAVRNLHKNLTEGK